MKVGIISKEAHAKSHAAALEEAGFAPVMLGSNPSEIPPTVPLVVCRTLSCAHGGMDTALAWSRAGHGTLIVENGVKVILEKALRFRNEFESRAPEVVPEVSEPGEVSRVSYEDLREAAQALAEARPDDEYGVFVEVLRRMYPHEEASLLRSVAASVRAPPTLPVSAPEVSEPSEAAPVAAPTPTPNPIPVPEVEATPMPLPPNTTKKPYPKRFSDHVAESAVDARMEKAWETRDALTPEQASSIGKWASKGAVGRVPHGDILRKFDRNPVGFSGLLLLCAEKPLALRDISRAYTRVFDKAMFSRMAEVAAWWLGMTLDVATNALPKDKPTPNPTEEPPVPEPVAPASEEATLALLKALSASLDALLAKVADIDGRVDNLTTRIESMGHAPVVTVANTGPVSTGDALAALAAKGLEVVVRSPSR
jgi:hypothetical protein